MYNVTTLHDIGFALLSELPSSFDRAHRLATFTKIVEILICDNFSLNKAAFEIAMDDSGGLRSKCAFLYDPATNFLLTGCKS
jgi:hypothetical protein